MEILIKLDKRLYKYAKHHTLTFGEMDGICDAIAKGVPLPKGHGRIIDERRISKCEQIGLIIKDGNTNRCLLTDAPTIIEADRSEEE